MTVKFFVVVGRARPTPKNKNPTIYKFKVFAKNDVKAKSLFWKHLSNLDRIKRANGQVILHCTHADTPYFIHMYKLTYTYICDAISRSTFVCVCLSVSVCAWVIYIYRSWQCTESWTLSQHV